MDVDPRLPANDRLTRDSATQPQERHYSRPQRQPRQQPQQQTQQQTQQQQQQRQQPNPLSYTSLSRADSQTTGARSGSDYRASPDSSHSQVAESTPSSHDDNPQHVGEFRNYLNEMSIGVNDGQPDDPLSDLKRPRACEACRQLKVRCELDNAHPSGSCKRCAKAKRPCVVTAPSRKRQKKTDSRVSELEKKIDALTATLQASRKAVGMFPEEGMREPSDAAPSRRWLGGGPPPRSAASRSNSGAPPTLASVKRTASGEVKSTFRGASSYGATSLFTPFGHGNSPETNEGATAWPQAPGGTAVTAFSDTCNEFADLIDRGLIDAETASKAFDRYNRDIAPTLPIVVFPPGTTMASVRREKPMLFLTIMSVAVGSFRPELQMPLTNEVHRLFADKVVVRGEKSLELVQAIVLSCTWYNPPDHFEELKFFPFIYMAVVMALDIGMGRVTRRKGNKHLGMLREILGKSRSSMDPDSAETRRTWLGAYFLAVNASMALRRPLLCRWHSYMDECIEILQTARDALPSDRILIHWAKLSHIAEEIGFQFSMDDPTNTTFLTDPKVQFALKGFESQLDQWRREIEPEVYTPLLQHAECVVSIYMHEISMHTEHNSEDFKPPYRAGFSDDSKLTNVSAAQVDALTACLTSIHRSMDIITSFDHGEVVSLPTVYFARTAYGFVALLKMFSAISQSRGLGQVFSAEDLSAEQYLDKVISHLKISGGKPGGRTAGKFCMVLNLLRNWFVNRKLEKKGKSDQTTVPSSVNGAVSQTVQPTIVPPTSQASISSEGLLPSRTDETPESTTRQWPTSSYSTAPTTAAAATATTTTTTTTTTTASFISPPNFDISAAATAPAASSFAVATDPMMTGMIEAAAHQGEFTGFAPELGLQMPFNPEGLFSIGNMLHEGIFDMPVDDEGNFFLGG